MTKVVIWASRGSRTGLFTGRNPSRTRNLSSLGVLLGVLSLSDQNIPRIVTFYHFYATFWSFWPDSGHSGLPGGVLARFLVILGFPEVFWPDSGLPGLPRGCSGPILGFLASPRVSFGPIPGFLGFPEDVLWPDSRLPGLPEVSQSGPRGVPEVSQSWSRGVPELLQSPRRGKHPPPGDQPAKDGRRKPDGEAGWTGGCWIVGVHGRWVVPCLGVPARYHTLGTPLLLPCPAVHRRAAHATQRHCCAVGCTGPGLPGWSFWTRARSRAWSFLSSHRRPATLPRDLLLPWEAYPALPWEPPLPWEDYPAQRAS